MKVTRQIKMSAYFNVFWIIIFFSIAVVSNFLLKCLTDYMDSKPPGHQSLYDNLIRNTFFMVRILGTYFSFVAIISRFDFVNALCDQYSIFLFLLCIIYTYLFVAVSLHASLMCLVKITCLINLTFAEEIGELNFRKATAFCSLSLSSCSCLIQIITGDVLTGTPYMLFTKKTRPSPARDIINGITYVSLISTFGVMSTITQLERWKLRLASVRPSHDAQISSQKPDYLLGFVSLLVILVFCTQSFFDFFIPVDTETYFLVKDSLSLTLLTVLFPTLIIVKNENTLKYFQNQIRDNIIWKAFLSVKTFCRKNAVSPDLVELKV